GEGTASNENCPAGTDGKPQCREPVRPCTKNAGCNVTAEPPPPVKKTKDSNGPAFAPIGSLEASRAATGRQSTTVGGERAPGRATVNGMPVVNLTPEEQANVGYTGRVAREQEAWVELIAQQRPPSPEQRAAIIKANVKEAIIGI